MPRKKISEQKKYRSVSRIDMLKDRIRDISNSEDIMIEIMDVFKKTELVPEIGDYCTFIYNPKTPDINYDQHPLVAVTSVERWGFQGINFHWNSVRRYTWEEVVGYLHMINDDEIFEMRNIKYAKFRRN
jgi:hypothetical protein